jgi:hypothetical protein
MDANFTVKMALWWVLTALLGIFVLKFYRSNISTKSKVSEKGNNKLGNAMVNMEGACMFGDSINCCEFTKYAIRGAMRLPQGRVGFAPTFEDVKKIETEDFIQSSGRGHFRSVYTGGADGRKCRPGR